MTTKHNYRDKATGRFIKSPASRSQELYAELYRAFDMFNEVFAKGKLPKVVITIQESGRRNAYGWFVMVFGQIDCLVILYQRSI